ncbi:hypothetical protein cand_005880 [Cryptosporidium andersoni]|uniref:Uncharacterized protein n=1 Tax=Cryptosporidium andersoni TaxID=117008 RepID=A0A1J4MPR2_9CRYT|nr:hypothetical protein cand_005880 [Cryptosporidium andersoni]
MGRPLYKNTYKKIASLKSNRRICYDIISTLYFATIWLWMFLDCGPNYISFFYYLTNWGWTLVLIFFISATAIDLLRFKEQHVPLLLINICLLVRELGISLESVIVPFFWMIVYPKEPWRSILWEIQMHGVGLVYLCFDYIIRISIFSSLSKRSLFIVSILYILVNCYVVVKLGVTIYPGITYNTWESWIVVSIAIILVLVAHQVASLITICMLIKNSIFKSHEEAPLVVKCTRLFQKANELRKKEILRRRFGSILIYSKDTPNKRDSREDYYK